ncbi:hypothetical protein A33Q_2316 [Indibacter alkaliphilus LW1]|uniref:DUF2784 domain-containing protein n=1 Tax=Indibacter alkaliphilus (strain CCUG 57479 / KCTC 22604 / LW1) TaxID=1189612 RepID=S2DWV7_INDAL|nr:DUF2784 domain-containing protein [Indibacter alkaliphilus]EOZ96546.1 hypothetical protein A33Q_2316 [Indibacter alkaliphilus LW1]
MWENEFILVIGDYFFLVFHTALVLFNLLAWLYRPLLKWHFITILITFASWGILGLWYGLGYCPLTDWHFGILRKLGESELPNSYISYLLQRLFNLTLPASLVDGLTLGFALAALIVSICLNFFKKK